MNFAFKQLSLWLKNGTIRTLNFEENKVNVITGRSGTGKTDILDIIDYCFFSSSHHISESIINENVEWYGITIKINNKNFTIARHSPLLNKVSKKYYFSSTGEIPDAPHSNNKENVIKDTVEVEFGINKDLKIPFGGKYLKANNKISLRYLLMFNTISENIISNNKVFFDKQNENRYREALTRIFDYAVGIDSIENILKAEKEKDLIKKLNVQEKKDNAIINNSYLFDKELVNNISIAKEFGIIIDEKGNNIDKLNQIVYDTTTSLANTEISDHDQIQKEIYLLTAKIRNLTRFETEYNNHKKNISSVVDSLKPVKYLEGEYRDLIKTSIYRDVINSLTTEFIEIKKKTKNKTPIDGKIKDQIAKHKDEIESLENKKSTLPKNIKSFENSSEKFMFIGELKAKLEFYNRAIQIKDKKTNITTEELLAQLDELEVEDTTNNRDLFIKVLEETIQSYIKMVSKALGNYGSFLPVFNYTNKQLGLRRPKVASVENIGSSSNDVFLSLFNRLGIHEVILRNSSPHIAPFLIIDQPSRPYWSDDEDESNTDSDVFKIKSIFKLLNGFITMSLSEEVNKGFQMIVFEHVPESLWEEYENFHLVEVFKEGNALIPDGCID